MDIIEKIGEAATLEQLAEECAELAHAALKTARIIRKENPTPVAYGDMMDGLAEEMTDVMNCIHILSDFYEESGVSCFYEGAMRVRERTKRARWRNRIKEAITDEH